MPELPEVESIVKDLRPHLIGRSVINVTVRWNNSVRTPIAQLKRDLPGQKIININRRGKYLQFGLSSGDTLILHLKMSGDLLVEPAEAKTSHVRTVFALDNGMELKFKDPRKFGRVYLVQDPNEITGKLGPEPLEKSFTVSEFKRLISKKKGMLKPLLLNQEFIAGLGNIYVDESCFRARVNPMRKVGTLKDAEIAALYRSIRQVLTLAIKHNGSTFDAVYRGGSFQNKFNVYGREDKKCRRCSSNIKRVTTLARSTHFCPKCQR